MCVLAYLYGGHSVGVLVGDWDISVDKDCNKGECAAAPQYRAVKRVAVAEDYMNPSMAHDISILELAEPVKFNGILSNRIL